MILLNWDSTRVSIWAMCAWTQCLSSLRLKACFDEFARFNFPCTIDCTVEYFWCGDEARIDHSSFSPRGGIKYQVFDTSLCIDLCSINPSFESCTAVYSNPRCHCRHWGSRGAQAPEHRSRAASMGVERSVPIVSSSELAVSETSVDSSLVDTRRPTQTKR